MITKASEPLTPTFFDTQTESFLMFSKIIEVYKPLSIFGKKDFLSLKPLNEKEIELHFNFLAKVEKCEKSRQRIEHVLEDFHEISASLEAVNSGRASATDLFEVKRFIHHHKILKSMIEECLPSFLNSLDDLWDVLDPQNSGSYAFAPYNKRIATLTKECEVLQVRISLLYGKQAEKIKEKFGFLPENKRFVIGRNEAKALLNSDLFMIEREGIKSYTFTLKPTDEILESQSKLLEFEERLKDAQNEELKRISNEISKSVDRIKEEIYRISRFDIAFAQLRSLKSNHVFPKLDSCMELENTFHPLIQKNVEESGFSYMHLNGNFHKGLTMIFGPNMGGKTTVLRTVGLVCALAMYGFLVPAQSAVLPKIDWIRYVGISDGKDGLSTFATQMDTMARVFKMRGEGLILVDEFGAGTNPYEGEALATALAKELNKRNDFSIMVTHYRKTIEDVKCKKYTMGRINFEGEITSENVYSKIDHHLIDGAKVELGDAIKLAEILGLPDSVVEKAKEFLSKDK